MFTKLRRYICGGENFDFNGEHFFQVVQHLADIEKAELAFAIDQQIQVTIFGIVASGHRTKYADIATVFGLDNTANSRSMLL